MFDPKAIDDPKLERLFNYWSDKAVSNRPAARAAIDPTELGDLIKNLAYLDFDSDRNDYVFTLAGSRVEEMTGRSLRGVYLSEVVDGPHLAQTLARFTMVMEHGEPHYCECNLAFLGRPQWPARRLLLPLSRNGRKADSLLFAAVLQPH